MKLYVWNGYLTQDNTDIAKFISLDIFNIYFIISYYARKPSPYHWCLSHPYPILDLTALLLRGKKGSSGWIKGQQCLTCTLLGKVQKKSKHSFFLFAMPTSKWLPQKPQQNFLSRPDSFSPRLDQPKSPGSISSSNALPSLSGSF